MEEMEPEEEPRSNTTILWASTGDTLERYIDESAQLEKINKTSMEIGKLKTSISVNLRGQKIFLLGSSV